MTPALRELVNRVKNDGYMATGDCDSALSDLIGAIVDYGNHEARSLILLLLFISEANRKSKPDVLALILDACIQFAFHQSRDGHTALGQYLQTLESK